MEKYISMAIRGVVSQKTDFPYELIVMDDCSSDSTHEIIEKWRLLYPDIIRNIRNPKNLGLQGNYMAGFSLCRGKYMAICDADDYWFHDRKLSKQVGYMEAHPECSITFHRMVNYYESSGEKSLSNGGQAPETGIEELSRSNYITNSSVMYRRECLDLNHLPEWLRNDRSPDYAMHMLYARHGKIHFFSRPMGVYRKTAGSSWSMTGEFEKLKMSLSVRLSLISELKGYDNAIDGLMASVVNILSAMAGCAQSEEEKIYVAEKAKSLGLGRLPAVHGRKKPRKSVISKIRGAISKFVPLPKP